MPDLFTDAEQVASLVEQATKDIRYIVTDFSFELMVSKFRERATEEGDIYVPDYQRKLAWNAEKMSYFIESLLLRVPIPPIFFYDVQGRLEIVDGSQRLRTMVAFFKDEFRLEGIEKLDVLNGYTFSELPIPVQRRLRNAPIRSFVLDQGTDKSDRTDLFRRLNTSGKRLTDAEVRKGVFDGPFLDLVLASAASEAFRAVTPHMAGGADVGSERQELATRFYVYGARYLAFRHDVRKFLDASMAEFNKTLTDDAIAAMRSEFDETMRFIAANYPRGFYRTDTGKQVARVRFEAVSVGTALALRERPDLTVRDNTWLRSDEFNALVRTDASNSGPKLRGRIEFVRDRLLGR